jgi:hypothetical protein
MDPFGQKKLSRRHVDFALSPWRFASLKKHEECCRHDLDHGMEEVAA